MNEIQVTLRGNVASEPRHVRFDDGNALTSFRLASTVRRFDRDRQEWVDRGTTYVNVTCRRAMAANAANSVHKGQPMVVTGRLTERFWSANGRSGQSLEIHADGLGHDLSFGTAEFARVASADRKVLVDVSALAEVDGEVVDADEPFDRGAAMDDCEVVDGTELMDEGVTDEGADDRRLDLTPAG
jgi:single-strand DNA-binding protein